jgi:hypothetical protein
MGYITLKKTPATSLASITFVPPGFPTTTSIGVAYNWAVQGLQLGDYDIGRAWTDAPGPQGGFDTQFKTPEAGPGSLTSTTRFPNPIFAALPGQVVQAWEPILGWGEFIVLRVPASTAVPVGTVCTWDPTYKYIINPTTLGTGAPLAVAVTSCTAGGAPLFDGTGVASLTADTYMWFQVSGRAWTLKTAVKGPPNNQVFIATATAGRVKILASVGACILGARMTATSTTATTTQSMVLVSYGVRAVQESS